MIDCCQPGPSASLERLWERRNIELRERTLWRLLYGSHLAAGLPMRTDSGRHR